MGKVSPLVESAMKDLLKTSDLGRADFMYFTLPDGIRNHIRRPVDAPIAGHFCIATASKLKKLLESSPIRGDRLVKAHDRDPVRL
jgi:hypothetical protein